MFLNLFSGKAQKERLDEVLERELEKHGVRQQFGPEFGRLALQYTSVAVGGYVFYLERTTKFSDSRFFIGVLCAIYFVFQTLSWLWRRTVEKNAMFIGEYRDTTVYISTQNPKNSGLYEVQANVVGPSGPKQTNLEFAFSELVDNAGLVHESLLKPIVDAVLLKHE